MKKITILCFCFSLLLLACVEDVGNYGNFWAVDSSGPSQTYYKINAQLLAQNDLCYVWAEKGSGVTEAEAQQVADSYKNYIYNKMIDAFGYEINLMEGDEVKLVLNNIQFANWLAKGDDYDGKLTILLLDIKDSYEKGKNESYIAGYFWAGNLIDILHSNKCDMIYVDTNPGKPGSPESNETLSHELQHLMNFAGAAMRGKATDLWIDEGLSVTAEWVYLGKHSERLNWYNGNGDGKQLKGLIDKGNNFFVWSNRDKENQYAVLDDYSTVYLFFQWLRLQSNKDIYKKISASKDFDYNAVIKAFNDIVKDDTYEDWEAMLKDWLAANYFKNSDSRYGYKIDTELNNIKIHYAPGGSNTIELFPGEGVYSRVTDSTSIPIPSGNIYYAGLTGSSLVSSGPLPSGALLTYNANTDIKGNSESGKITGAAPPPSVTVTAGSRSAGAVTGPFPISAGDMLRQNGNKGGFNYEGINFKLPDAYRGIIINE
jgi:hypothetical protein